MSQATVNPGFVRGSEQRLLDGCRLRGTALQMRTGSCDSPTRKGLKTDVCGPLAVWRLASCLLLIAVVAFVFRQALSCEESPSPQGAAAQNLLDVWIQPASSAGLPGGEHLTLTGGFQIISGGREGTLSLTAECEFGWHVYSITQKDGGPQVFADRHREIGAISVERAVSARPVARRQELRVLQSPGRRARRSRDLDVPIRLAETVAPEGLVIRLRYNGQVCADEGAAFR